jgi:hypothetical protein
LEASTSDGVAKLFSGDASIPWRAGATLSVTLAESDYSRINSARENGMKVSTYDVCIKHCSGEECGNFKKDAALKDKRDWSASDVCKYAQEAWHAYEAGDVQSGALGDVLAEGCAIACEGQAGCVKTLACTNAQAVLSGLVARHSLTPGQFPDWKISGGLLSGARQFTWLDGSVENDPTAALTVKTETRYSLKAGVSATHVQGLTDVYGLTLEAHGSFESRYSAASTTAHYCQPVGTVSGATAEHCSDTPLGAPVESLSYGLEVDVGVVDNLDARWRAALGARWEPTTPGKPARFALRLPFYVNFANAPAGYTGSYKGLLRITPTLAYSRDPTLGFVASTSITVDIFGDMSMFPEVLDYR